MFAGRFVPNRRYKKKPLELSFSPRCPISTRSLTLRHWVRKCTPRNWKFAKLFLLCSLGLVVYSITVVSVKQSTSQNSIPQEIRRPPSFIRIVKQVHQYVTELLAKTSYSAYGMVQRDPNKRTPQKVIWDNNLLYFHKVRYNFNASAPHRQVDLSDLRKVLFPPLGTFGRVEMAYNSSQKVTNSTAELSDVIYVAPSDYICRHTPSPLDKEIKVVLITTMLFRTNQTFIMDNTIRNWARLRPYVQPVLYITPSRGQPSGPSLVQLACTLGWDVYIVPESSSSNFPVLRTMVEDARQKYPAPMVGYANGDILFDNSLPETLEFFLRHHHKFVGKKYQLITGLRRDIKLSRGTKLFTLEEVTDTARKKGVLHESMGFDYFFSTHDGFPWSAIPPFVIARPVFDNWLVWWSIQRNGPTVCLDATDAITAVHQEARGTKAGWKHRKLDVDYNANMVPVFPVRHGNTDCIARKLIRINNRQFEVKQSRIRPERIYGCKAYLKEAQVVFQGEVP